MRYREVKKERKGWCKSEDWTEEGKNTYIFGEGIFIITLSEPVRKDELALVENGNTHSLDTVLNPGILQDRTEICWKTILGLCCCLERCWLCSDLHI